MGIFMVVFGLFGEGYGEDLGGVYYLDEIVVTATRYEMALKDLSVSVSVITEEDIEASNIHTSTDILNTLPGVFIQRTGDFGRADVVIRGIGDRGRKVMVLVDGRPVKMGLFGCTITHSLPADNVKRIEVIRGPLSVLYGSDALGGVINIITKKPSSSFEGDFTLSYGDFNTWQYRLRTGGRKKGLSYYITGDWRLSDGHLPNSAYDGKELTSRLDYKMSNFLTAVITGKYFDGYKEEPSRITDTVESELWNRYKRWALDFTLQGGWEKSHFMLKVYHNAGEHRFSDGWHSKDYTNGFIFQGNVRLGINNTLTFGADLRAPGGERLNPAPSLWDKKEYGFFLHDAWVLFGKAILNFGARYNKDEIAGEEISPQVGLVVHPIEGTLLKGLISKGFRSPQINELYMFPASNTQLSPEIVWNYEAGFNQRIIKGLNIEGTFFVMKGDKLIELQPNPAPPPMYKFQNSGVFEFRGMEIGLIAQMSNIFSARIYHSYLDPAEKTRGRPKNKTDINIRFSHRSFGFFITGQHVTDYFAADSSREPIPSFWVFNCKAIYKLFSRLKVFVAVDNILNEDYAIYADLPGGNAGVYQMPKRRFTVGSLYKF